MPDADYCEIQVGGHRRNSPRFAALVDAADAEAIGAYRWSMSDHGYAWRTVYVGGKKRHVRMHRQLLGLTPGDGVHVDHINGAKLDNRRGNLRVATHAENQQNRHGLSYRGASWYARGKCWHAQATLAGNYHHLGYFATREEAAAVAAAFRREHMPFSADARGEMDGDTPEPAQMQTYGRST
jgi:hypothetical protein